MVTTRHKAAVEAGEAPPQPRKHYTEIGLEESEEGENEAFRDLRDITMDIA